MRSALRSALIVVLPLYMLSTTMQSASIQPCGRTRFIVASAFSRRVGGAIAGASSTQVNQPATIARTVKTAFQKRVVMLGLLPHRALRVSRKIGFRSNWSAGRDRGQTKSPVRLAERGGIARQSAAVPRATTALRLNCRARFVGNPLGVAECAAI